TVRIRHLEEREPDLADFRAELQRVASAGDREVLDEVPNVAVLFGRQPVVGTDLAVSLARVLGLTLRAERDLGKSAVQRGGRIEATHPIRLELVRAGVCGLHAGSH